MSTGDDGSARPENPISVVVLKSEFNRGRQHLAKSLLTIFPSLVDLENYGVPDFVEKCGLADVKLLQFAHNLIGI
jgi:hypothetical protein